MVNGDLKRFIIVLLVSARYSQVCRELESQWQQPEAIGFNLGCPLLVLNVAKLFSKRVGETGKNIQTIFADAKKKDAILDEAE